MDQNPLFLVGFVVAAHLIFLFLDFNSLPPPRPTKKSIRVCTFSPAPSTQPPRPSFSHSTTPSKRPEKINGSAPLSTKKNRKTAKEQTHLKEAQQKWDMLKKVEQSLKKIDAMAPFEPKKGELPLPLKLSALEIDRKDSTEPGGYLTLLMHALKEALELPEHGNVTLALTIGNSGKVLKLQVLQSASDKNRAYLEGALLTMTLPPFSEDLKSENEQTWMITFCNEI